MKEEKTAPEAIIYVSVVENQEACLFLCAFQILTL